MSRLLVCPPDFFGIEYEINPWMRLSNRVDHERAISQWQALMGLFEKDLGIELERMTPIPGLPDLVFTANAGIVVGRTAVVSHFRHPERQREEAHFAHWFREQGYEVMTVGAGLHFEGAGDLLGLSDTWFGGYRQRSDIGVYPILSEHFHREIIPLELVDSRFYHLDTCLCPLSSGELLYFPAAFDRYGRQAIADRIPDELRFAVPNNEAAQFACNAVCIGNHVVLPAGCPTTQDWLQSRGYTTHSVQLDEFMKSGGAAKCLTLALD
jgi:N-dimethylarginine dimethylaminohydrolase